MLGVDMYPRAVVGLLRSPRDRSSALALLHEFPFDSQTCQQAGQAGLARELGLKSGFEAVAWLGRLVSCRLGGLA